MTPPFRYQVTDRGIYVVDGTNNAIAEVYYNDEEAARLVVGLLNGHFGVPVVFHANPIFVCDPTDPNIGNAIPIEFKQV